MSLHPQAAAPRDTVLGSLDYSGIELAALAQACLEIVGWSRLADIINETGEPGALHGFFASKILGISEEAFKALKKLEPKRYSDVRTCSKRCMFGMGGGMGAVRFVLTCRKGNAGRTPYPDGRVVSGLRFCVMLDGRPRCGEELILEWKKRPTGVPVCRRCVEVVEELRKLWFATFPEVRAYHDYVSSRTDGPGSILVPIAGDLDAPAVVRGGLVFTEGANGGFQTRAAIGAKRALWPITLECFTGVRWRWDRAIDVWEPTDEPSPLADSRVVFFVHDENVFEFPEVTAHEAAYRGAEIMVEQMRVDLPDIRGVLVDPALMRRWLKPAERWETSWCPRGHGFLPDYVDHAAGRACACGAAAVARLRPWDESPDGLLYLEKMRARLAA